MKSLVKKKLDEFLQQKGKRIVQLEDLYEWQRNVVDVRSYHASALPAAASSYLRPDNQKLVELQKRYTLCDPDVITPFVWQNGHVQAEDIAYFRGDNPWVWQLRGSNSNVLSYALAYYYVKSIDHLGLLDKLTEDDNFGNFTFQIAGRAVSRDLLDSIIEIYFLDRHLGISSRQGLQVIDIGAGYGRLAHRMVDALPNLESYTCTDAVAISTFVSDYYLNFRGASKAAVVPLDEIEQVLGDRAINIAVNIHSFSECSHKAIEWWIKLLSKHRVRNLMIVPNTAKSTESRLLTNDRQEFLPILEKHGYHLIAKEPKYRDPVVQQYGPYPTWHHLFELKA